MHYSLVPVAALLLAADIPDESLVKQDLKKLEGTWKCISLEVGGKKLPDEKLKETNLRLVVKGDKWIIKSANLESEVSYKIDPTKKPKAIDTKHPKGKTNLGIYELEGDRLKFCDAGHADRERPKEFTSEAGTPQSLWVFERVKK
jgi:uncharacterized protein (TIGR03067 family)